jgi:hypothetical protein
MSRIPATEQSATIRAYESTEHVLLNAWRLPIRELFREIRKLRLLRPARR